MRISERYDRVFRYLKDTIGDAQPELDYTTPFELLVAVILSAQCTDKRVNMVTPALFAAFPNAPAMAATTPDVIYTYISSVSYPKNKAAHLVAMAQMLCREFGGEVPRELSDLVRLPGVGRKTANVIRAVIFGEAALAVDTHVFRVSHRLGLVPSSCTTPLSVENRLKRHIPAHEVAAAHHQLLLHGRYVCTARRPHCETCGLTDVCAAYHKGIK